MNQEAYKEAEAVAIQANVAARKALAPYWDGLLNFERACNGELADDPDCPCEDGWEWLESAFVSIEDDGRLFLAFGGPNIWIDADDGMQAAWWGFPIRSLPPSAEHEDALRAIRDYLSEVSA